MLRLLVALVFLVVAVAADAQEQRFAPEQRPRGGQQRGPENAPLDGPDLRPGEIQRIFDGYLLVQVQEALGLTNEQFAQMVPRIKALQDARRRHQQERARLLGELQRLSRPLAGARDNPPDEGLLKERLTALQENDARFAADVRKAYSDIDQLLDLRQQARFRVFEEAIERKKLDLLLRARQNQDRAMPKRPPPH